MKRIKIVLSPLDVQALDCTLDPEKTPSRCHSEPSAAYCDALLDDIVREIRENG